MADLAPPSPIKPEMHDPGAHDLVESSDEHFSDASEGQIDHISSPNIGSSGSNSPIPTTRVERVDDEPSYGEIPGTNAYEKRKQDAVPDEIEIIPEGSDQARSRSASRVLESDRPTTPGGTLIPKTIVEKVEPEEPSFGEIPGTVAYEKRKADADPDVIIKSPSKTRMNLEGEQITNRFITGSDIDQQDEIIHHDIDDDEDGNDDFDDFDDFEAGEEIEVNNDDNDNDDFDGFEEAATPIINQSINMLDLPQLSFNETQDEIKIKIASYIQELFPDINIENEEDGKKEEDKKKIESLLSDRSASLWEQLVAPPPLQPPNWIKSRIRRLFLVSLGIPVDLDEILPASKQKKLVLPFVNLEVENNERRERSKSFITEENVDKKRKYSVNNNNNSGNNKVSFDINLAARLSSTTDAALLNFTVEELEKHVEILKGIIKEGNSCLEHWTKKKESAKGDKEAFEGVIENLVGFVSKSKSKR